MTEMSADKPRNDLPTVETDTRPYWEAAKAGKLLIARCDACGKVHHYPRPFCPSCWSEDVSWLEASGRATVYTWSTVFVNDLNPFNTRVPYVAAVVELEEGPRVMTEIVDCEPTDLSIGMPVEVAYHALTDEITRPVFRPV